VIQQQLPGHGAFAEQLTVRTSDSNCSVFPMKYTIRSQRWVKSRSAGETAMVDAGTVIISSCTQHEDQFRHFASQHHMLSTTAP
jgi:hypothetical protein